MGERKIGLVATIGIAVVVLVGVSIALLVFDPRTTGADALRTGGLAAGSVVALYALWLNDRRRRTEEKRQELETKRQELDRERYALEQQRQALEDRRTAQDHVRASDERFARAVELLGNEADQVRVGALHSLAGLARNNPDYTQTVLDVLCSYLRRPFDHPKWTDEPDRAPTHEEQHERTVRQTAIKLLVSLLPQNGEPDPPRYDLDVANARLDRFSLSGRVVGRLDAHGCLFRHRTNFTGTVFHGKVDLRDSTFLDPFDATGAVFHGLLASRRVVLRAPALFSGAEFHAEVSLRDSRFAERVSFGQAFFAALCDLDGASFDHGLDLRARAPLPAFSVSGTEVGAAAANDLPDGWTLTPLPRSNRARISVERIGENHAHG
ncbi:hypothetical protein LZ318_14150 [Saccharopolyspora indica]|uniref:pentapeptide repeat-containing protein n=1 Tax=Saccharopolyspora indica TaxID=1229659 RepID=UPI0022EA2F20|nr:pentapeptide repeat-containing protein [Saccharopolyspora indica]MDA3644889.1 hypothetical protein [Saccharopolyspora indica]